MPRTEAEPCELCILREVLLENGLAYARTDSRPLTRGHVLVIPKRHVASFFDMTLDEQSAVLSLLREAQSAVQKQHSPDGYNIGVNVGKAAGQSRMHVHVHLFKSIDAGGALQGAGAGTVGRVRPRHVVETRVECCPPGNIQARSVCASTRRRVR